MIAFTCSQCGQKFQVKDEFVGRTVKCPACKQPLTVPVPSVTAAPVATGEMGGPPSSLARAGLDGGVTLAPIASAPERLSLRPKNAERYTIEGEIARGGMGAVLRAVDYDIRREVAVKYLLDQLDPNKKLRFVEEAQITGQLEHPNIVPIHELGMDGQQRLFFAMKMVKGRSLAQVLDVLRSNPKAAEKEYTLSRLLNILVNICHALAYAHARGVIHRDLKPANIMLGDFGEVYVMDWGLAKVLANGRGQAPDKAHTSYTAHRSNDRSAAASPLAGKVVTSREPKADLTQEGAIVGTPVYMAPEQAKGHVGAIDQRSDIYALGAILYELLTWQPPIEKEGGYVAILTRVVLGKIEPPEQRAPQRARAGKIPRELSAIAMKALALEPADRYQNVEALRRDVERFLEGRSVSAKHDTKWEMLVKFVRRNKAFSAAIAAAAVLLAVVVGVSFHINYQARLRAEEAQEKAEEAQGRAETALVQVQTEQARRAEQARNSIAAFLRSAKVAANERRFDDALTQVRVVLGFDPDNAAAQLLKGKILILKQDFKGAADELNKCVQMRPGDKLGKLIDACGRADPNNPPTLFPLLNLLQPEFTVTGGLRDLRDRVLEHYRPPLEKAWPGLAGHLSVNPVGRLELNLDNTFNRVTDLSPLEGMPLTRLDLANCSHVKNLKPLHNLPLTVLNLNNCRQVQDLGPLEGLPLTHLDLAGCTQIKDFAPITKAPLYRLNLGNCTQIHDLTPFHKLRPSHLDLMGCPVEDLRPLHAMPLTKLNLAFTPVRDLTPLRNVPLEQLDIVDTKVEDVSPLAEVPLEMILFTPKNIHKGIGVLRRMKTLKRIGTHGLEKEFTPEEFWKRYDAGQFKK